MPVRHSSLWKGRLRVAKQFWDRWTLREVARDRSEKARQRALEMPTESTHQLRVHSALPRPVVQGAGRLDEKGYDQLLPRTRSLNEA